MWNKRDEVPPANPGARPMPADQIRQDTVSSPAAIPRQAPREPVQTSPAAIGSSMVIKGDIYSREELYVDGEVEGKLELQHRLTIGPHGKIRAHIKAREVVIAGNVQGNVEVSEKITIQKNGSLVGDIKTAGIVIDDGAYFKGSIDIVKAPPITPPPAPNKVENKAENVKPPQPAAVTPAR